MANWQDTGGMPPLTDGGPPRFPIKTSAQLHDAMQALGRVKAGDKADVIAHIKERAGALGLTSELTDTYRTDSGRETLYRSLEIGETTGRTLSGIAMPWDRPTRVRDLVGPAYMEAFAPQSTDVSIRQHASFPMFVRHDYGQDPIGVVTFHRSAEALMYEAPLSKTVRADEQLELVNDGAMRSVSVGFKPLQAIRGRMINGATVDQYRTEVALRELSLAPTGFGQYAEAGVTAVRSDGDDDPGTMIQAVDAVIDSIYDALNGGNIDQALALLTAADVTVDALLGMFNLEDADDIDTAAAEPARMLDARRKAAWGLLHRRRRVARLPVLPTF